MPDVSSGGYIPVANAGSDPMSLATSTAIQIVLLFLLILLNAFFSMAEIAIISLNDNRIRKLAGDGHKAAQKILTLSQNSSKFLATIQVGVTISGFLTSAAAAQSFTGQLTDLLSMASIPVNAAAILSTIIITIVLSYFSLVLGELVPKRIAMQHSEAISFKVIGVIQTIEKVLGPFIMLLSTSTNFVIRILGGNTDDFEEAVTEEEILMMVDVGEENGIFEGTTKDMIKNIFDFDDTPANEIMTHRTDMTAVDDNCTVEELVDLAISYGYSRIPVFHGSLDNIIGIVYVKDLLKYVGKEHSGGTKVTKLMRDALYIPETKLCSGLFQEMTSRHTQIAIVVDEYGGTEGLITMEDLVEAILGNIQDEYDNEEDEIQKIGHNTFTVDGVTSIDEVSDLLGVSLPDGDYDTVGGFMSWRLGRIPSPDEHPSVDVNGVTFTVKNVEDRRITKVSIIKKEHARLDINDDNSL